MTPASPSSLPTMSDVDNAMRIVKTVRNSARETSQALRRVKNRQAAFEEREAAAIKILEQAIKSYHSAQSLVEAEGIREDVVRHSRELDQLRQDHQATMDAKNNDFEHQWRLEIDKLCCCFVDAVGLDFVQNAIRNSTKNPSGATGSAPTPADQPTPPATEPEPEVASPAEHPARSPPASPERPVRADAGASSTVRMPIAAKHGIYC